MIPLNRIQVEDLDCRSPRFLQKCHLRLYEIEHDFSSQSGALYQLKFGGFDHHQDKLPSVVSQTHQYQLTTTQEQDLQSVQSNSSEVMEEKEMNSSTKEIISGLIQSMSVKAQTRLDEVLKFIIRKILKNHRKMFSLYFEEITGITSFSTSDPKALQQILTDFMRLYFDISSQSQLEMAQAIFYNYKAKCQQGQPRSLDLVSKGTKKGALDFFSSKLARRIIYPQFRTLLIETKKCAQPRLRYQITSLLDDIERIIRSHASIKAEV